MLHEDIPHLVGDVDPFSLRHIGGLADPVLIRILLHGMEQFIGLSW